MSVDKHNYEAFFLDYIEGSLSVEMTAELLLFLEKNPSIKEELEGFELIELNAEKEVLSDKNALKMHIDKNNVEDYIIGSIEGVNSKNDDEDLSLFIEEDNESAILFNRYKKTVLTPTIVVFPTKNRLKKRNRVVYLYPLLGAAASLLLFFMISSDKTTTYNPKAIIAVENTSLFENDTEKEYVAIVPEEIPQQNEKVIVSNNFKAEKDSTKPIFVEPQNNLEIAKAEKDSAAPLPLEEITPEIMIAAIDTSQKMDQDVVLASFPIKNVELTVNEWANRQVRKKVLKQDTEKTSKIEKDEVFDALANGFNKISKQDIVYSSLTSKTTVTKGFSIGSFEFSRTKKKKNKA